jgi:hypothetical protein
MVFQICLNRTIPQPSSFKRHVAGAKPSLRSWSLRGAVVSNIALVEAFHPIPAGPAPWLVIKKS